MGDGLGVLDQIGDLLRSLRRRCVSLPRRARERVVAQLEVALEVRNRLYLEVSPEQRPTYFTHYLQGSIAATREVVAHLVLPPPLVHRRWPAPQSFASPEQFAAISAQQANVLDGLDQALEPYRQTELKDAD